MALQSPCFTVFVPRQSLQNIFAFLAPALHSKVPMVHPSWVSISGPDQRHHHLLLERLAGVSFQHVPSLNLSHFHFRPFRYVYRGCEQACGEN